MSEPVDIPVVAAVIERQGRFLVGRRPEEKRHGGLWEFPGGKVDPGESLLDAARRELAEELELRAADIGPLLLSAQDAGSPFVIHFVPILAEGEPRAIEHTEVGWFAPHELLELALAPTDRRFAEMLASRDTPVEPEPEGSDA